MNCEQTDLTLLKYPVLDDYEKRIGSSCRLDNTVSLFQHLSQAKISCNSDENCIGIYEQSCDNSGPFLLCHKGFATSKANNSACLYEKKNYSGIYLLLYILGPFNI